MVISNKWRYFKQESQRRMLQQSPPDDATTATTGPTIIPISLSESFNGEKSVKGQLLDEMRLTKECCRRMMLTQIDAPYQGFI